MCDICKGFKSGAFSPEEAREALEDQSEFLTDEHIEDVEQMILLNEDSYDFLNEFRRYVNDEDEFSQEHIEEEEEDYEEYPEEDDE